MAKVLQQQVLVLLTKKPILRKAIVKISPEDKCNAETVDEKDKSVYFEGVKQKPQNLPDPKNKNDGKGSHLVKKRENTIRKENQDAWEIHKKTCGCL